MFKETTARTSETVRTGSELVHILKWPETKSAAIDRVSRSWSLQIPKALFDRIGTGNPDDPVLRQFLPDERELQSQPGFSDDPLAEENAGQNGILRKYEYRALVVTTASCVAHCRYCFRRHARNSGVLFAEPGTRHESQPDFASFFEPVCQDSSLHELILSGGDPLTVSNPGLKRLFHYIKSVPHVNRVRIHTRAAILTPSRVDDELEAILTDWVHYQKSLFFVFHVNHPNELNEAVFQMFDRVRATGSVLLSQSVLLKGVNDSSKTLGQLFETLTGHGVLPYYLHQLDRVSGAADFEVPEERGREIMDELRRQLPGYAVPRYVRELPKFPCKIPL